jgi:biopolymer transport protein ExbD
VFASVILGLASCSSEPASVVTAKLEVSESGTYTLDGVVVARDELKYAVKAKRPESGTLLLHIAASSRASFEAVGHAMQAAQYAGAQVGIVGNERL